MNKRWLWMIPFLAMGSAATGQSDPEYCAGLIAPMSGLATQVRSMAAELEEMPVQNLERYLHGGPKSAAADYVEAHRDLLPRLGDYVTALEDLTYALQVCSRDARR